MPAKAELQYEITLDFPGEPRFSDFRPTDFGAAWSTPSTSPGRTRV